ncbi:lipopolysaccharide transport periplasmic protein LptA [Reinekea marinisedimentorum]|uniref:Lipopolysaccharide export system protein LptA n=1 Tax=Reinekea marinisedimentorum TaxID=230495 RepID=A0A4R3HZD6_9GAMM|nr:lipopolysaccharide transport periplasmic protein LptA [Reinekea marinisedimentorum]TCS37625.1 lipopolysaccharide export system protein LptA [Reinekea marinisedimentorum]
MTPFKHLVKPVVVAALLHSSLTFALPEDRNLPITGKADTNTLDTNTGTSVLTGNVVINQGKLQILADQVTIITDPETNDLTYMKAIGKPAQFTDIPELDADEVEVTGDTVEYYPQQNLIVTLGNSQITQSGNEARGEKIEYDTLSGQMVIYSARALSGDNSQGQAELLLQPGTVD